MAGRSLLDNRAVRFWGFSLLILAVAGCSAESSAPVTTVTVTSTSAPSSTSQPTATSQWRLWSKGGGGRLPFGDSVRLGLMEGRVADVLYAQSDKAPSAQQAKVTVEFRHLGGEDPTLPGSCRGWNAYDSEGQMRQFESWGGAEVYGGEQGQIWTTFLLPEDRKLSYLVLSCTATMNKGAAVEADLR